MEQDLLKFIKFGLRNKWQNFSEEELDAIISEYINIEERRVGDESNPAIHHAITHEEINNGKINNLLDWGEKNLQDVEFWCKVSNIVNSFAPVTGGGILMLILHFRNANDAALFTLCWK